MTANKTSAEVADEKIRELRAVIREANELLRDYKTTLREAKELLGPSLKIRVQEQVKDVVKADLDDWGEKVNDNLDKAIKKVLKEFDELTDMLMGRSKSQKRRGEVSVTDVIKSRVEGEAPPNS